MRPPASDPRKLVASALSIEPVKRLPRRDEIYSVIWQRGVFRRRSDAVEGKVTLEQLFPSARISAFGSMPYTVLPNSRKGSRGENPSRIQCQRSPSPACRPSVPAKAASARAGSAGGSARNRCKRSAKRRVRIERRGCCSLRLVRLHVVYRLRLQRWPSSHQRLGFQLNCPGLPSSGMKW